MKKIISTFLLLSMFAMTSVMPSTATAATTSNSATFAEYAGSSAMKPCPAGYYRVKKSSIKRSTKLWNTLIATGIGAAIGGGIGGGRGALIGGGSGAGGYLTYRYIKDRRGRCVPRYVRG